MLISKALEGFLIELESKGYSQRTIDLYRYDWGHLIEFLGDVELETVTREDLVRFMVYLRKDYRPENPVSGSWLDNHWKVIRRLYRWAETMGIENAAANLPRPKYQHPPVSPFTADEIKKLIKACEHNKEVQKKGVKGYSARRTTAMRDKALILLLLDTGIRLGELVRLKVDHVNLATGEIRIISRGSEKKSRARTVFLGKQAKRTLWQYLANRKDQDEVSLFGMRDTGVQQLLRHTGERAGVTDVHPHRFRHTCAIMYLRNGGDVITLQRILGHGDLESVKHYLALVKADVEGAHRRASPVDNL